MTSFNVGVKLLDSQAQVPTKAHDTDAGFDLYSIEDCDIQPKQRKTVRTGVSLQIPDDYAGLIWPRSGLSVKKGIDVLAGVIDAGYRGEIMVCLYNTSFETVHIKHGDKIAQIIFQEVPKVSMISVDTLESSQRGDNGFGSTDTQQSKQR
jgi:dUTP pyrophosphatase